MRGLGDYQPAQMKGTDPRLTRLFHCTRKLIDILEQITLHPHTTPDQPVQVKAGRSVPPPPPPTLDTAKLAYTVKKVRKLLGISHTKVYQAMKEGGLRAVKCGHRTLILAKDLQAWIEGWPERR
jgi:excisionase family DNA binding protein